MPVRELQGRLLRLRNRDREFSEEQGINVAFLACGFLNWVDENDVRTQAPLVLLPCSLDRASPRDPFLLKRSEDEILTNITLVHKLQVDLGFQLPAYDPEQSVEDYLENVDESIVGKTDWKVSRTIFLGTFQYSKMAMWEDLEAIKESIDIANPLVRYLAGDLESGAATLQFDGGEWFNRDEGDLAGGVLDDFVRPQELPLVMPADFSQLQAIGRAKTGNHLVIHGPPGTGKSQTISNLIGAFIHEGKSVLFVSEKTAALDVVKRRLDEAGLGILCFDLHSERGKKARAYEQLRQSVEYNRSPPNEPFDHSKLLNLRRRLNAYVRALHQAREPLGLSVYQVNGMFAQVKDYPDLEFELAEPRDLTLDILANFTDIGSRLAARQDPYTEHLTSRWHILANRQGSLSLPDELRRIFARTRSSLEEARKVTLDASVWLGISAPESAEESRILRALLEHLAVGPRVERVGWQRGSPANF